MSALFMHRRTGSRLSRPPASYQGARPGEYWPAPALVSNYAISAQGDWHGSQVGATLSHSQTKDILFMYDYGGGLIVMHGWGRGFQLWGPTGVHSGKGSFSMTVNGRAYTVTQAIDNPNGTSDAWPYYTHTFATPRYFEVVLLHLPQQGVYPVNDGFSVLPL